MSINYTIPKPNLHLMTKEIEPNGNEFVHIFKDNRVIQIEDEEGGVCRFINEQRNNYTSTTIQKPKPGTV